MSNMTNDPTQPLFPPGIPPVDPVYGDPSVDPVYPPDEPAREQDDALAPPLTPPGEEPVYPDEPLDDPETLSHRTGEELITDPAEEYDQGRAIGNLGSTPDPADEYDQPRASGNLGPHE